MSIKRGKLEFQNVIGMKTKCKYGQWEEEAQKFKAFLIQNDLFITGPVILQWGDKKKEDLEVDVTIYLPLYQKISLKENDIFFSMESFSIKDGLKIRHLDMEHDFALTEMMLEQTAQKLEVTLHKSYYYIYLPVYNEYIVDIYAQIEEGDKDL